MTHRDDSLAIVRAVSAIGLSLGMLTTAEGVETREQFERIRQEGCTEAQGYFFSPPLPAREVAALLATSDHGLPATAELGRPTAATG